MENDVLAWLVEPENLERFKSQIWGRTPVVFKGSPERSKVFQKLFSLKAFNRIVKRSENSTQLKFGVDILTAQYRNGIRERPTEEVCDGASLWRLFRSGSTLQFVQPQRFLTSLQGICARLESELECLVGCNAYMTPSRTQGLAPHHDDVELFICQTQGSKTWKLYEPMNGFVMPNAPSEDFQQEALGRMIMEVTLDTGDVLYMPKGIIHQAVAQDEDSVHLTISTYQTWSWGDLTNAVLEETLMATSEPVCLPESMRHGLPLGLLSRVGTFTGNEESCHAVARDLAQRLRDLAAAVEAKPEIVQSAADVMAYAFMARRMPPSDDLPLSADPPKLQDKIRLTGKGLARLMPVRAENGTFDEAHIQVISCINNKSQTHMMQPTACADSEGLFYPDCTEGNCGINSDRADAAGSASDSPSEDEDAASIMFDMSQKEALLQIFRSGEEGVHVHALHLPNDAERLHLSAVLWENLIVQIA